MSDGLNPYQSPEQTRGEVDESGLPFVQVVKRGFAAARRAPTGALWVFVLMAPVQMLGAVTNSAMFGGDFFDRTQRGDFGADGQMPPEMMMLMGSGCAMCAWIPVMFFAMPWVMGGTLGQIRDRLTGTPLQSFHSYGKRFYVTMLLLFMLFTGIVIALSIPNAILSQFVTMSQIQQGSPMTAEELRAIARHPWSIALNIVGGLVMTAVGTVMALITATVALGEYRVGDALRAGLGFCAGHSGEVLKLFGLYVLLLVPVSLVQWGYGQLTTNLAVGLLLTFLSTIYLACLTVVNYGIAGSLLLGRVPVAPGTPVAPADSGEPLE